MQNSTIVVAGVGGVLPTAVYRKELAEVPDVTGSLDVPWIYLDWRLAIAILIRMFPERYPDPIAKLSR